MSEPPPNKSAEILHEVSDALTEAVNANEAMQMAEELQAILWHDGPDTQHNADTLNQVANLAIKYGYGPKEKS